MRLRRASGTFSTIRAMPRTRGKEDQTQSEIKKQYWGPVAFADDPGVEGFAQEPVKGHLSSLAPAIVSKGTWAEASASTGATGVVVRAQ